MSEAIIIQTPGTMTGSKGKKLENYVGIEFTRGASNNGGEHGYHKMIGDEELLKNLPLFDQIKLALVKDAAVTSVLNQTNINKTADGGNVDLTGADGSDIMQVLPDLWCINGGTDPTYERYIYSDSYFEYGNDKAFKWNAFARSPSQLIVVNNKARSIYSNNPGYMGTTKAKEISDGSFADNRGYPTAGYSRPRFEAAAKARNADVNANKPYMNGTTLDMEIIMGLLFVECRTKDLTSVFGHGISSNVVPSDSNWNTTSGFRTLVNGTYKYFAFNSNVYIGGENINIWSALNGQSSLTKVLEPQKLVSDGATLTPVYNSDGQPLKGISNGVMTGVLKKTLTFKLTCGLAEGEEETEHLFEMNLMNAIWRGDSWISGNVWKHLSGYEVANFRNPGDTADRNILFRAKDIESIVTDSNFADSDTKFDFESIYEEVCDLGSQNTWTKNAITHNGICLAVTKDAGGAINNYQSAVINVANDNTTGKRRRKTAGLFGGYAYYSFSVPRCCAAVNGPSYAYSNLASRFRCELVS